MDDLSAKINSIMSDPEKLKELQQLGQMMGLTGESGKQPPDLSGILSPSKPSAPPAGGIDPQLLSNLAPLLMNLNKDDDTTRLFDALMPFLSAERQEKLQKIRKMTVLMKLLPNLRGLGLF